MDWLGLLAVQGTLKSLLQHHSSKASILRCSASFMAQLSPQYGPSIPRWISVPLIDHGRGLEAVSSDHVILQREERRQVPERLVHGHTAAMTDPGPTSQGPSPPAVSFCSALARKITRRGRRRCVGSGCTENLTCPWPPASRG